MRAAIGCGLVERRGGAYGRGVSPLQVALVACAALAALCWLLAEISREYSWVDRLWSLVPPAYVAWFATQGEQGLRLGVMLGLSALWGARLTYNFARKGGYRPGGEDYRWAELRRRISPGVFRVFNLVFVAVFQNVLLLLLALPAWYALGSGAPWGRLDTAATLLFLVFLIGETIADEQQWRFQQAKRARGGAAPHFVTSGLFRFSRHPNFFCEMGIWWAFYLFSVAAGAGWVSPALLGPALLTALFQGSTGLTEALSRQKYPAYAEYQRTASRLVPWWPRR